MNSLIGVNDARLPTSQARNNGARQERGEKAFVWINMEYKIK